jgi:hypothetical protein
MGSLNMTLCQLFYDLTSRKSIWHSLSSLMVWKMWRISLISPFCFVSLTFYTIIFKWVFWRLMWQFHRCPLYVKLVLYFQAIDFFKVSIYSCFIVCWVLVEDRPLKWQFTVHLTVSGLLILMLSISNINVNWLDFLVLKASEDIKLKLKI